MKKRFFSKKCKNCGETFIYEIEEENALECKNCKSKIEIPKPDRKLINLNGYRDSLGIYFKSPLSRG